MVEIEVPPDGGKVCGLCGSLVYTGTEFADIENNRLISVNDFFQRMAEGEGNQPVISFPDACSSHYVSEQALNACGYITTFATASLVVNLEAHLSACMQSVCNCLMEGGGTCLACEVAEHIAFVANNEGVPINGWRSPEFCRKHLSVSMFHGTIETHSLFNVYNERRKRLMPNAN